MMNTVASVSELGDLLDLFLFFEVSHKGECDLVSIPDMVVDLQHDHVDFCLLSHY